VVPSPDAARSATTTAGRSPVTQVARAALLASALVACDAPAVNAAYGGPPPFAQLDGGDDGSSPVVPSPTGTSAPVDPGSLPAPAYGAPPPLVQPPPPVSTVEAPATVAPVLDAGARKKRPR
jgi:hypothetical protein